MNVLIVNEQENIISSLNIEIIKTLRGVFSSDELINTFSNFFFARMIVDVTALENSNDIVTYQKLSIGLPTDKIILLIPPDSIMANNFFLSKLISMGYYNFTTNAEGIQYLLNTPNTYKDVAHLHQIGQNSNVNISVSSGNPTNDNQVLSGVRILGFKNVTIGAGASSLIYMMKKQLEEKYSFSVLAIEVNKRDFTFFREKNMLSTDKSSVATELLKAKNFDYILVDLNDYDENICDDIIYLIELSIIKLNKLMTRDKNIFAKLKDRKVIINKSIVSDSDIEEFSSEAGIKIFSVLPFINDREPSEHIDKLLLKLGLIRNL